ncbi:MAG: agmatine deiminase family protein [Microbacteriaceae bacterium]|nr:agmatine deiminase family protein [Microbacteriaceae bacterium]
MSWKMPAEWVKHERTWLSFPSSEYGIPAEEAYRAWSNVANAASEYEPVTVLVDPAQDEISKKYLSSEITKIVCDLDDSWIRDNGATFVVNTETGKLGAVDWRFNGWGSLPFEAYQKDDLVAAVMAELTQAELIRSELVNEGGGIHVNGNGLLLVTETVQLGQERNPDWTRAEVEQELKEKLGVSDIVWVRRGLTRDYEAYGTKGHIDIVASFADEQTILMHDQQDDAHPDFSVSHEVASKLGELSNINLIKVPAPKTLRDSHGFVDYSYINHYILNGAVLLCAFEDENDAEAKAILTDAYPGREIRLLDARPIFARGGGIHCITQQQPAV